MNTTATINTNCFPCNLDGMLWLPIPALFFYLCITREIRRNPAMLKFELPEGISLLQSPYALDNTRKFSIESISVAWGWKYHQHWPDHGWVLGQLWQSCKDCWTLRDCTLRMAPSKKPISFSRQTSSPLSPGLFTHFTLELSVISLLPLDPGSLRWFKSRAVHIQYVRAEIVLTSKFKLWLAWTGKSHATIHSGKRWVKNAKSNTCISSTIKQRMSSAALQRSVNFISPRTAKRDKPFLH